MVFLVIRIVLIISKKRHRAEEIIFIGFTLFCKQKILELGDSSLSTHVAQRSRISFPLSLSLLFFTFLTQFLRFHSRSINKTLFTYKYTLCENGENSALQDSFLFCLLFG